MSLPDIQAALTACTHTACTHTACTHSMHSMYSTAMIDMLPPAYAVVLVSKLLWLNVMQNHSMHSTAQHSMPVFSIPC